MNVRRLGMRFCAALWIWFALWCVCGLSISSALAEEAAADTFVSPTRNPNAVPYSTAHPDQLQAEQLVARSFLLMEYDTGEVLFEQNADEPMPPASTTKILTALVALQYCDLDDIITVSDTAVAIPDDASSVDLKAGEKITLRDALYGMMLPSGNDAAIAIAEFIAGDQATFVQELNRTAEMLGCTDTVFTNAHGYQDEGHHTTARDLAIITRAALSLESFRTIVGSPSHTMAATDFHPARKIYNTNLLLQESDTHYYYPYAIGVKTGFHSQAGYTLVAAAEKNGVTMIAVALYTGKYSRWADVRRLLEYGFTQYKSVTPQEIYRKDPTTMQISGFDLDDPDLGRLLLNIQAVDLTRNVRLTGTKSIIDQLVANYRSYTNISWIKEARAPIAEGDVMGILTFYPEKGEPAQYELVASRSIAERKDAPPTLEEIEQAVLDDPSPLPPFSWDWILPPLIALSFCIFALYQLLHWLLRKRKKTKRIPKPKRRYFG